MKTANTCVQFYVKISSHFWKIGKKLQEAYFWLTRYIWGCHRFLKAHCLSFTDEYVTHITGPQLSSIRLDTAVFHTFVSSRLLSLWCSSRCRLMYVIVKKRIAQRFFERKTDGSLTNPPPGTVVDTVVTRPNAYVFVDWLLTELN